MQELSAYLLQSPTLPAESLEALSKDVSSLISAWLEEKGATHPDQSFGDFESKTGGGKGLFTREVLKDDIGILEDVVLEEKTKNGQVFTTRLSHVRANNIVSVHAVLSISNTESIISPVFTNPRCPAIVRRLLSNNTEWLLNGDSIGQGKSEQWNGTEAVDNIVRCINSNSRTLPLILVSEIDGDVLWPRLESELAFDLAGLAHVVRINEEASWALTDEIGKQASCYLGAVRLYWPIQDQNPEAPQYPGTVWTASALLSNDQDGKAFSRFRNELRKRVMSVAALTIVPPSAIRAIRNSISRSRLKELQNKANANQEDIELARIFIDENEQLKEELTEAKKSIANLSGRVEAAEYALSQQKTESSGESVADINEDEIEPGEIRYYKKIRNASGYDVLARVSNCGHSSWQNASKAEKAKKGVERLEGRSDWKTIQHCGSCTGGGMWKVKW